MPLIIVGCTYPIVGCTYSVVGCTYPVVALPLLSDVHVRLPCCYTMITCILGRLVQVHVYTTANDLSKVLRSKYCIMWVMWVGASIYSKLEMQDCLT